MEPHAGGKKSMKIGLFMAPQWAPDVSLDNGLAEVSALVRCARHNGFKSLLVGQHMVLAPIRMYQPMPLLAWLARDAEGMQIGPGVLLLSMLNPVMAAEEAATLDWITDGNFVFAVGLGYRAEEFTVMGAKSSERVGRFTEALDVVKRLWTQDTVTHEGQYFTVPGVGASIRPKQEPRPPIWMGGGVDAAVRRAARLGDAWVGAPVVTVDEGVHFLGVYAAERERLGLPIESCPLIRECFVGKNTAHAHEVSRGPLLFKYEAYASWGQDGIAGVPLADRFDDFSTDRFLLGDTHEVRDEIQRYGETLGVDHLLLRVEWPGLDHREALSNIERIADVVGGL
jgi:alkanesulfonate monooxygenase SsuD/methylene tetrahydromethanopterin reductase-like flavin-dependent oxidoreductase (luciferase family)